MKKLICILLLFNGLQLVAQDAPRPFGSMIYGDLYLGLLITGDYSSTGAGVGLGYRFNDRHALGVTLHGISEGSTSTTRSAACIGVQYRYDLKRWSFDAGAGYVHEFRYTGDIFYPTEAVQEGSDPWYYRLGVRRRLGRVFYLGLSYAQSGPFVLKITNTDEMPPELTFSETLGVHAFTLNLGWLFQKQSKMPE